MADDEQEDFENPRDEELSSLTAIYPEIQQPNLKDKYTIALDVPVTPSKAVVVYFPATASDDAANANTNVNPQQPQRLAVDDSHELAHLPSIHLELAFGPRYPSEKPPHISISTDPPWLPAETIKKLQDDGPRLWEDMGRDIVGYAYIDHIHQAAEDVFGLVGDEGGLEVDPRHKIAILDYDIQARKAAFEKETFDCGICLDPKKGTVCHRMMDCQHVFCVECLQDYYNRAIKEGDLAAVRCPAPSCARDREKAISPSGRKRKKPKVHISPSELLQIPIDQETVKRYVTLKYKTELESDKNTIYCPRPWCNGAARSKKHKKPQGLELADVSDDSGSEGEDADDGESVKPDDEGKSKPYKAAEELLAVCEDCNFAFCSRCMQSWHGEYVICTPRRENGELSAEELASLEYMKLHTTPCPTCAAPAQKTHGCNHMICYRCQSHFCYLCSAWLNPENPYQHFNEAPNGRVTGCYMRLWELELGDGDDVGYGFAGGAANGAHPVPAPAAAAAVPDHLLIPEIEEATDDEEGVPVPPAVPQPPPQNVHANGGQVGIAREGPLVLRIAANQPAGAGRGGPRGQAPAPAPAPAPAQAPRGGARGANRGPQQAGRGPGAAGGRGGRGGIAGRGGIGGGGGGGAAAAAAAAPAQRGGAHARRGGRGGGGPPHRQNNNQAQQQRRNAHNNQHQNQNQNGGVAGGGGVDGQGGPELDPAHEAWVRQFVAMALNDEEDLFFEDFSDED